MHVLCTHAGRKKKKWIHARVEIGRHKNMHGHTHTASMKMRTEICITEACNKTMTTQRPELLSHTLTHTNTRLLRCEEGLNHTTTTPHDGTTGHIHQNCNYQWLQTTLSLSGQEREEGGRHHNCTYVQPPHLPPDIHPSPHLPSPTSLLLLGARMSEMSAEASASLI